MPSLRRPSPSSHINQILHVGLYPGYLSWFQVSLRSVENAGAAGVEISALPLTRLIDYTIACCYRASRDNSRCAVLPLNPSDVLNSYVPINGLL